MNAFVEQEPASRTHQERKHRCRPDGQERPGTAPGIAIVPPRGSAAATAAGEDMEGRVRTPAALSENSEPSPSYTEGPQPIFHRYRPLPPLPLLAGRAPAGQCVGRAGDLKRKSISSPASALSALSALSSPRTSWQRPCGWDAGTHLTGLHVGLFLFFLSLSLLSPPSSPPLP